MSNLCGFPPNRQHELIVAIDPPGSIGFRYGCERHDKQCTDCMCVKAGTECIKDCFCSDYYSNAADLKIFERDDDDLSDTSDEIPALGCSKNFTVSRTSALSSISNTRQCASRATTPNARRPSLASTHLTSRRFRTKPNCLRLSKAMVMASSSPGSG
jgi:hypothetical protein